MFNSQRLILGRKRRKLTARALALAIGVSPITISRLENGVNEPEDDTVEALARALNFASAFLMPTDDVMSRIRYVTDLENLIRAKKRWGVSVAALNYRLHKLRVVSEWQNRSLNIEMSSRGFRRQEPEGLPPETSSLWPQIFTALWRERITRDQIAAELNVPTGELDAILHRLTGGVPASAR